MQQNNSTDMIVLGKINGFYGVKGWVKLFSHTQPRAQILDYNPLYIRPSKGLKAQRLGNQASDWTATQVINGREQGQHVIAHFEGFDSKEIAAAYLGYEVAIHPDQLESLEEDAFYWRDLIGLKVYDLQDQLIGNIRQMLETGANDVMIIKPASDGIVADKSKDVLIPFTLHHHVQRVDLDQQKLVVDWDPNF